MLFNNVDGASYSEIGFPAVLVGLVAHSLLRHLEVGACRLHVAFELFGNRLSFGSCKSLTGRQSL
ncbi:hypothetical protein M0657_010728 [Pyricularia oryzae]|nr:hypothetical protein M9X92_012216 [Pyricularia oryzae]KAI7908426.1 hypothetical protein M9X92_012195 [Pyricularia oryzae]KAI7911849.1 hypothetical protein M0657_010728 [Pyricularia oryzae]